MKRTRKNPKRWIQAALAKHKKGALHKQLGIPLGAPIPLSALHRAERAPGLLGKRARLAETLIKFSRNHTKR
jgi:hypothetical protein